MPCECGRKRKCSEYTKSDPCSVPEPLARVTVIHDAFSRYRFAQKALLGPSAHGPRGALRCRQRSPYQSMVWDWPKRTRATTREKLATRQAKYCAAGRTPSEKPRTGDECGVSTPGQRRLWPSAGHSQTLPIALRCWKSVAYAAPGRAG